MPAKTMKLFLFKFFFAFVLKTFYIYFISSSWIVSSVETWRHHPYPGQCRYPEALDGISSWGRNVASNWRRIAKYCQVPTVSTGTMQMVFFFFIIFYFYPPPLRGGLSFRYELVIWNLYLSTKIYIWHL